MSESVVSGFGYRERAVGGWVVGISLQIVRRMNVRLQVCESPPCLEVYNRRFYRTMVRQNRASPHLSYCISVGLTVTGQL